MKKKNNLIGFRTPSEEEKEILKKEAESLGLSMYELVKIGIKASTKGLNAGSEQNLLFKKQYAINERDEAIIKITDLNRRIESINRRLKSVNSSRYKDLPEDDSVIHIYDKDLNSLELDFL